MSCGWLFLHCTVWLVACVSYLLTQFFLAAYRRPICGELDDSWTAVLREREKMEGCVPTKYIKGPKARLEPAALEAEASGRAAPDDSDDEDEVEVGEEREAAGEDGEGRGGGEGRVKPHAHLHLHFR